MDNLKSRIAKLESKQVAPLQLPANLNLWAILPDGREIDLLHEPGGADLLGWGFKPSEIDFSQLRPGRGFAGATV